MFMLRILSTESTYTTFEIKRVFDEGILYCGQILSFQ